MLEMGVDGDLKGGGVFNWSEKSLLQWSIVYNPPAKMAKLITAVNILYSIRGLPAFDHCMLLF